jgi:hypothetical protein
LVALVQVSGEVQLPTGVHCVHVFGKLASRQ